MIKVGIVGGTGYTGVGVVGLILKHPSARLVWVTSESHKEEKLASVYPHLTGLTELICRKPDIASLTGDVDVVFIALPNGMAMEIAPKFIAKGIKVIDLSADFRFKDPKVFSEWYSIDHSSKDLLSKAVYGLSEVNKVTEKAELIANPGCYATASILAVYPLITSGIIDLESVIIDAKSGVSGAGKTLTDETHFPNCNEGISAYKVASHRHTPEIEQSLGAGIKVTFTPHLIPMTRGILATVYGKAVKPVDEVKLTKLFKDFYKGKPFVRVLENILPSTKYVCGTNFCDIAVKFDKRTGKVIVLSAIDNLMKGAAGQAVQNMNLAFSLAETTGLEQVPIYP